MKKIYPKFGGADATVHKGLPAKPQSTRNPADYAAREGEKHGARRIINNPKAPRIQENKDALIKQNQRKHAIN